MESRGTALVLLNIPVAETGVPKKRKERKTQPTNTDPLRLHFRTALPLLGCSIHSHFARAFRLPTDGCGVIRIYLPVSRAHFKAGAEFHFCRNLSRITGSIHFQYSRRFRVKFSRRPVQPRASRQESLLVVSALSELLEKSGASKMSARQKEKAERFRKLHEGPCFIIPNPWDVGSAKVLAGLGFPALATSSAASAAAIGKLDHGLTR